MVKPTKKITPFLWFDHQAEEAAMFYISVFKNSKIETVTPYGGAGPGPKGSVMTIAFELDGQKFVALKGGPQYQFNPAISFVVNCKGQQEVDKYSENAAGTPRLMKAMTQMKKLDIAGLKAACHRTSKRPPELATLA